MKNIFHILIVATFGILTLTFVPAADAQNLTIERKIIGVSHSAAPDDSDFRIHDYLISDTSTTFTADLSQYTTFTFHYTAPEGQKIVVREPGQHYDISLNATAVININGVVYNNSTGTLNVSFDGFSGVLSSNSAGFVHSSTAVGMSGERDWYDNSGSLSFTGFTISMSNVGALPSGVHTYHEFPDGLVFAASHNVRTDPGAFVSLQNISNPVPEPTFYHLSAILGLSMVGMLTLRRKH